MTKRPASPVKPPFQDAYYWILSEEGFLRLAWIEDKQAWYVEEAPQKVRNIVVLAGPLFDPTEDDIARWQADPVMRERHLHAMEQKEKHDWLWEEGYYWVWPRHHQPMIALCNEMWMSVRYDSDKVDLTNCHMDDLDGLVLYGPLEKPAIPAEFESLRFVSPWQQDADPPS